MPEKIEELVRAALAAAQEAGDLSAFELDDCAIERPADTSHGEWTSTMALKSAKLAHCAPRKIAEAVVAHMPEDPAIEKVEIAGPGFINFYLSVAVKNAIFGEAREKGMDFAKSNVGGGLKTQVEDHGGVRLRQPRRPHAHRSWPLGRSGRLPLPCDGPRRLRHPA